MGARWRSKSNVREGKARTPLPSLLACLGSVLTLTLRQGQGPTGLTRIQEGGCGWTSQGGVGQAWWTWAHAGPG